MFLQKLNGVALKHVHQDIVPAIEKVVNLFSPKNRRLTFTWRAISNKVNIM